MARYDNTFDLFCLKRPFRLHGIDYCNHRLNPGKNQNYKISVIITSLHNANDNILIPFTVQAVMKCLLGKNHVGLVHLPDRFEGDKSPETPENPSVYDNESITPITTITTDYLLHV